MPPDLTKIDFDQPIPIFPLPNTVLLPRAILPLHMFEPRCREMTWDVLQGQRLIAMALLKPGYEAKYYTHVAPIHRVLCLGYVLRDERLNDGRYNILLQGLCRATVAREDRKKDYRRGWLTPIATGCGCAEEYGTVIRRRLAAELNGPACGAGCSTGVLRDVVRCTELSISDILDLLTFNLIREPEIRQRFLEETSVGTRARWVTELLTQIRTQVPQTASGQQRPAVIFSDN